MWKRSELKRLAKMDLKQGYWMAVLLGFFSLLLEGATGFFSLLLEGATGFDTIFKVVSSINAIGTNWVVYLLPNSLSSILRVSMPVFLLLLVTSMLYLTFIGNVIQVGATSYYIQRDTEKHNLQRLLAYFDKRIYLQVVKTQFIRTLIIFLWLQLLIIPGIIQYYEYYFVSYIIAENPHWPHDKVFELSRKMTDGQKMHIFVLDLSFIVWLLLAFLIPGGFIFLTPYMKATSAQLYLACQQSVSASAVLIESEENCKVPKLL